MRQKFEALISVYRELQAIDKGEVDSTGLNSLDKERNLLNDDPKWLDTGHVLAFYKTEPCKKPPRLCRQGYACPQYHNNKDKRRSPMKYKYRYAGAVNCFKDKQRRCTMFTMTNAFSPFQEQSLAQLN